MSLDSSDYVFDFLSLEAFLYRFHLKVVKFHKVSHFVLEQRGETESLNNAHL